MLMQTSVSESNVRMKSNLLGYDDFVVIALFEILIAHPITECARHNDSLPTLSLNNLLVRNTKEICV